MSTMLTKDTADNNDSNNNNNYNNTYHNSYKAIFIGNNKQALTQARHHAITSYRIVLRVTEYPLPRVGCSNRCNPKTHEDSLQ